MAEVIAKSGLPCCLMHNRKEADYRDFMQDVAADLADTIHLAEAAGIADEKIILDPGVGFGKTYENNLEIINCLEELNMFGYPLLLGCSRTSVIGLTLDLPVTERVEGTLVTAWWWEACPLLTLSPAERVSVRSRIGGCRLKATDNGTYKVLPGR